MIDLPCIEVFVIQWIKLLSTQFALVTSFSLFLNMMLKKKELIRMMVITLCLTIQINTGFAQQKALQPFPLSAVRLHNGPFLQAQQRDLEYILALDVDRLLVPFLREAGIETKVESYGNWENTGLDGHIGGHYLSALAQMFAVTENKEMKRRLDYMVDQLSKCQQTNGNGYVGGIPGGKQIWSEIKAGKIMADNFSLNKKWVPLYNIHKLYAGLRDAYQIGGNAQARLVFIGLCDWFYDLTADRTDAEIQMMLKSEHGGMNEVFADAAEITGDKKYLVLAKRLSHRKILNPLLHEKDSLTGLHANTQIPKVIGFKKIADMTDEKSWSDAADFFWNSVVENRSVSIGGNSVREHFHPTTDFSSMIESNQGPETCNTFNMLRLTKALYLTKPDVAYIDYYERATYNHILSSQHPVRGGFVYFTPMRPRHYRVYSSPQESFWCCVGSGIENHIKYGELIYAHNGKDIFVNLFIPSKLTWKEKSISIDQETDFPNTESTTLTLEIPKPMKFTINVRIPGWVDPGKAKISVNGKNVDAAISPSSFANISRKWKSGDVISVTLPMRTTIEYLPGDSSWGSFIHGPVVLAAAVDSTGLTDMIADDGRMAHVAEGKFLPIDEAPVMVNDKNDFTTGLKRVDDKSLTFTASSQIFPQSFKQVKLVPFSSIHDVRYMIYWQLASAEKLDSIKNNLKRKEADRAALEAQTVDYVVAGEQQPETEHKFQGDSTFAGSSDGRTWRNAWKSFSYELRDQTQEGKVIRLEHDGRGRNTKFDLIVNGQLITTVVPNASANGIVYSNFEIPVEILGKTNADRLTVKLAAHPGSSTGRIYEVRLMRKVN